MTLALFACYNARHFGPLVRLIVCRDSSLRSKEKTLFLRVSTSIPRPLRIAALFLFLGAVLTASPVFSQANKEGLKISDIRFEGNKNISTLILRGKLLEVEGDIFSLRRARMDIHNLFASGDFKDVKLEAEAGTKSGEVILVFKVVERPLVGQVLFQGNKKWGSGKFLEEIKTAPKASFDQAKVNDDVQRIKKLYQDEGYASVVVASESKPGAKGNVVDVVFDITEGPQIKIGGISISGPTVFSEKKVADQMKENRVGEKYKPDQLDADLKKIEDFYRDEGYLRAAVLDHAEKMNDLKKRVYITITLKEGDQYRTGDIRLQGNVLFEDEELIKTLGLKKGDVLKRKDLDEGARKIKMLYSDKGYIYASANPEMKYDDDAKKADLSLQIQEGSMAYVQDVKIVGNYKTRDYVIRRELALNAGDKFEASKIRQSMQNLLNLGFFDEVNPEVEPGDTPGKEVLVFRVKERHTGQISLGGGYSSVDGFVGTFKLSEANLFGKGQNVNGEVEFGASRFSFNAGFTEPWLFNTPTSLGVNGFYTTRYLTSAIIDPVYGTNKLYTEVRAGGSLSLGRRLSRYWSIYGTYSYQNVQITDVGAPYSIPGTSNFIEPSNSSTSSFTPRLVYDSRDNYFDPTTGWRHQLSIQLAGGPLGADNNYVKAVEDTSHFIPLPLEFVLGEHVRFGVAQGYWFTGRGYSDVPVYEKFYTGGADTVRGYNERSVGPQAGGNAMFVFNTELKHTIAGPLRGVMFLDAGDTWSSLLNVGTGESNVQWGTGLGLRLTIPGTLIAIRLDYGWPIGTNLPASAAPPGGVLHFNLGDLF